MKKMHYAFAVVLGVLSAAGGQAPDDVKGLDLYLLIGQSNMAGRGKLSEVEPLDTDRLLKLDASDTWVEATEPIHFDKSSAGVGLAASFARVLADRQPTATIGLIPCAVGGTGIDRWVRGGDLFDAAVARTRKALKSGTLKGILWHQGENDSKTAETAEAWGAKLQSMVEALRAEFGNVPFVAGELGRYLDQYAASDADTADVLFWRTINGHLHQQEGRLEKYAVVSSEGLTPNADNLHFDARSLRELGVRYARALLTVSDGWPSVGQLGGPFPTLMTPYQSDGSVDFESLEQGVRSVSEWCPGVVWGLSADSAGPVSQSERAQIVEACASAAESCGVVLGLGANGTNTAHMIELVRLIETGAVAHPQAHVVIVTRPPDDCRSEADVLAAGQALGATARRPVVFLTRGAPGVPEVSAEVRAELERQYPLAFGARGGCSVRELKWGWLHKLRQGKGEDLEFGAVVFAPMLGTIGRRFRDGELGARLSGAYALYHRLVERCCQVAGRADGYRYLLGKMGLCRSLTVRLVTSGAGWTPGSVVLTDGQKAELDEIYTEMMNYVCGH